MQKRNARSTPHLVVGPLALLEGRRQRRQGNHNLARLTKQSAAAPRLHDNGNKSNAKRECKRVVIMTTEKRALDPYLVWQSIQKVATGTFLKGRGRQCDLIKCSWDRIPLSSHLIRCPFCPLSSKTLNIGRQASVHDQKGKSFVASRQCHLTMTFSKTVTGHRCGHL